MINEEFLSSLVEENENKIVLLVIDGLGGLEREDGKTELDIANTYNIDGLLEKSSCGLHLPVSYGITPGSGPGHLGIFGYDPTKYEIGRGILSALGINFPIEKNDLAARGNFATIDKNELIVDRRAGRIETKECERLCNILEENIKEIDGVKIFVKPEQDYRFLLVLRDENLEEEISETDPQHLGVPILESKGLKKEAEFTASIINKFTKTAVSILKNESNANGVLLRGFAKRPKIKTLQELYKLRPAAIAQYPMYKGLARLVGMEILKTGGEIEDEITTLKENFENFDFFFVHIKKTDSYGEDGNFDGKVKFIERIDSLIPEILKLNPSVLAITGDHSTPSVMKAHSFHPVPFMLYSKYARNDGIKKFSERELRLGSFSLFPAKEIIALLLAHSLKLKKFGA